MIDIDKDSKRIFFYHSQEWVEMNPIRYNEQMYDFELLSGHICPECNCVIDGYYVGELPFKDSDGTWEKHPYIPTRNNYCTSDPHYQFGHKYGGGYLIMCNHNDTYCKTHIASIGGITEGIKSFIDTNLDIHPTDYMISKLAADIFEKKIPGIFFIEDVCNLRLPILAITLKTFTKNISYKDFSELDKEHRWNLLFAKLVIGDQEIKITGGN